MAVRFLKTKAVLSGNCTVEEAEEILQWLMNHPKAELNMTDVTHMHAAALQAIAAVSNRIVALPGDAFCARSLRLLGRA